MGTGTAAWVRQSVGLLGSCRGAVGGCGSVGCDGGGGLAPDRFEILAAEARGGVCQAEADPRVVRSLPGLAVQFGERAPEGADLVGPRSRRGGLVLPAELRKSPREGQRREMVLPAFQWQGKRGLTSSFPQKNKIRVL